MTEYRFRPRGAQQTGSNAAVRKWAALPVSAQYTLVRISAWNLLTYISPPLLYHKQCFVFWYVSPIFWHFYLTMCHFIIVRRRAYDIGSHMLNKARSKMLGAFLLIHMHSALVAARASSCVCCIVTMTVIVVRVAREQRPNSAIF